MLTLATIVNTTTPATVTSRAVIMAHLVRWPSDRLTAILEASACARSVSMAALASRKTRTAHAPQIRVSTLDRVDLLDPSMTTFVIASLDSQVSGMKGVLDIKFLLCFSGYKWTKTCFLWLGNFENLQLQQLLFYSMSKVKTDSCNSSNVQPSKCFQTSTKFKQIKSV